MTLELVPIFFNKIMQSHSYTVIIVGNDAKQFPIYTDPSVGLSLQKHLAQEKQLRPMTHNLIHSLLSGLDIKILQIVINDLIDTVYFARLFLEQKCGDQVQVIEIDARPSDSLILALMSKAPLFCKKEVFETAMALEE